MTDFPPGFFDRADDAPDSVFYEPDRFVTHIDDGAIAAVSELYRELVLTGDVLDLCSSWVSHFPSTPDRLVALGMNANELAANPAATDTLVHDLNVDPHLPFDDASFDAVTCCVSIDYLVRPVEVFDEVARVLRRGAPFVVTFSNRCFPNKAIRAWLAADDRQRCSIVAAYFGAVGWFAPATVQLRNPSRSGDPLYAVWASTYGSGVEVRPATAGDQAFVTEMLYEALFVPPGATPLDRSIVDEVEDLARYHRGFGAEPGDVGRVAHDRDGEPVGAAWVRQLRGYGFVDERTPELSIAVVGSRRGSGVGAALLASLLDAVPRASLSVDRRNPAVRLYERLGFEVVDDDGEHTLVMLRSGDAT
ncbi:MAG: GNAT family N-acetyltransferase [Ilumatobacteraceae bacterium]|nr:GNAT family N-acetyltransferase [Ilumatobacteraceae bacterium]